MCIGSAGTEMLRTKLYPPRLPAIVPRETLLEEISVARAARLITIVAGAGYGKSTLAVEFLESRQASYAWYQLEDSDRDLSTFINYLVAGVRLEHGEFGERTLRRLESVDDVQLESRVVLSTLISEMDEYLEEESYVALDDFHNVNGSPQIIEALDYLLGHMPPNVHFLLLSRSKPDLDISELAAHRELVEVTEADLCFSPDEISTLFSEVFGMPLKDEYIWTLSDLTEGWVSGLVLFYLAIRSKSEDQVEEAIRDFDAPTTRVAEYLSKAVYGNQREDVKQFLMKTSILARMNPGFCDELLRTGDSRETLGYLTDERLFTIPLDDGGNWFRYHHSLRKFLQYVLADSVSPDDTAELNHQAAALWERFGEPEEALAHYMEAKDYQKAADILARLAPGLLDAMRFSFLHDQLNLLPEDELCKHPWLVHYLAYTTHTAGEYDRSVDIYRDAASLFQAAGDIEALTLSLLNRLEVLRAIGRSDEAEETIRAIREIAPDDSSSWHELAAIRSITSFLAGYPELSEKFLEEALPHTDEVEDETARTSLLFWCGFAAYVQGNYKQAYETLSEAYRSGEACDHTALLPRIYAMLSNTAGILGRFTEALEYAEKGLAYGELLGPETPMALLNRSTRALALATLGDLDEALEDINRSNLLFDKYGANTESLLAENNAGWVYALCGDSARALEHFKTQERICQEVNYPDGVRAAKLSGIWLPPGDLDLEIAREEIGGIIELAEGSTEGFTFSFANLILAFLELSEGMKEGALKALDAASLKVPLVGWWRIMWRYTANQKEPVVRALELATEILSEGKHFEYLGHMFETAGPASLPYLRKLEKADNSRVKKKARELIEAISREAAEPLVIRALGPFEVRRGNVRITGEDWKSKKALTILKYLAAQRNRSLVPRDVLMELLWPNRDPGSASKNLNMALTSLRKTLEPDAARGQSSYIISGGDSLRLELGSGGWVDFQLFRDSLLKAKDAKRPGDRDLYLENLLEAEKLYQGAFLEEDLYEDWCRSERDVLKEEFLTLLRDISSEYLARGKVEEALLYSEKAIEASPGREGLYRCKMEIYGKMGDRAGIERTFKRCCEHLEENFDVSPSPETEALYHKLRGE